MGASFVENLPKSFFLFAFRRQSCWYHPPDLEHQFPKRILKVTRIVKIQTFRQLFRTYST